MRAVCTREGMREVYAGIREHASMRMTADARVSAGKKLASHGNG